MDTRPDPTETPRSRRALLAGLAGGVGAWAVAALERATPASAASGDAIRAGRTTAAGAATTTLTATTAGAALKVAQAGSGVAIRGESASGNGGYLKTAKATSYGVYARNTSTSSGAGAAVFAEGNRQVGVKARSANPSSYAVEAIGTSSTGNAIALYGETKSTTGLAILGLASAASGASYGVYGQSLSPTGHGVFGYASSGTGENHGVYGYTNSFDGDGVQGRNVGGGRGVHGESTGGPFGAGVTGHAPDAYGVWGSSTSYIGVHGSSTEYIGVWGQAYSSGHPGVYGASNNGPGVEAHSSTGPGLTAYGTPAATFYGSVNVTGTLSKGGGAFRIDHPLEPARKYLQHSFVESPDMLNIYNGVITADAGGHATVELPSWFGALNRDVRYALTPIGEAMPDLHVRRGVARNRFEIGGAAPRGEVSWQVTGVRKDAWAEANRIEVEMDKPAGERGRFLHPELHGKPASKAIGAEHRSGRTPREAEPVIR